MATLTPKQQQEAEAEASKAKSIYLTSRTPATDADDWNNALRAARTLIADALRDSNYLVAVDQALQKKGAHMLVFRHITAPPISQDQFALACPEWRKNTEKPTASPPGPDEAAFAAAQFAARRSVSLTQWLNYGRPPRIAELRRLLWSVAPLIASQQLATLQRNRYAAAQEQSVLKLLRAKGWTQLPGSLLDKRAELPLRHFMHKTRYATASEGSPQEVDIALGLRGSVVLATECKVSNDATNSVKRINDVLKKATAWKTHWGSFVKTAAILQGVIAGKEVVRLIEADVIVFWSHDLAAFDAWIDSQT
jgi:hypothetical protein